MKKKKTILIIGYYFTHKNAIASVRLDKLTKYLLQDGYDVTVLSSLQRDTWIGKEGKYSNIEIKEEHREAKVIFSKEYRVWSYLYKLFLKIRKRKKVEVNHTLTLEKKQKDIDMIINFLREMWGLFITLSENTSLYFSMKKNLKDILKSNNYDIVFSSHGPPAILYLGKIAKKWQPKTFFIADYRDEWYKRKLFDNGFSKIVNNIIFKSETKILSQTDLITFVSKGLLEQYRSHYHRISNLDNKLYVLSNGFDKIEYNHYPKVTKFSSSKFHFCYTGYLYSSKSDISVIFSILHKLISKNNIDTDYFCFHYAGSDGEFLKEMAKRYGLEDSIIDYGFISREESINLQKASDLLIVATWNNVNETGIVTGKIYEYLLSGNPIIGIVTGDLMNSELKDIIREAEVGVTYEYINNKNDYRVLEDYITFQICYKANNGVVKHNPNNEYINNFDYMNIVSKFTQKLETSLNGMTEGE